MTEINTAEFMRAFDAGVSRAEQGFNDAFRAMVLQLFAGIVKRTPVDSGRLRGNWQVGINSVPSGEIDTKDKRGQRTITKGSRTIDTARNVNDVYLVNNLPYAEVAEFGEWGDGPKTVGGYSKQAPSGMVRVTLTEFEQRLREAARDNQI